MPPKASKPTARRAAASETKPASAKTGRPRTRKPKLTRPATPRQTEILTYVRDYQHKHGYSPTYDEIAEVLGISKVTVFEHLTTLEERGLLRREKHKARSLLLADHLELPDERPGCIPLEGRIAAGAPIEAVENREVLNLDAMFDSPHGVYALEVKGDSMIEDHIDEGDYVVIENRKTPYNGEMVVAYLDEGEVTLKRYYREKSRIRLQPSNPKYEPIYSTNVEIQGVVIGVIRRVR
ncbi:MAG: transcriptional repressor LexA [Phycisphaerales bacterium]|nr:transcriptional repressor LexA [Phycisphaerales bacterium]MCB9864586.1 transcriptional repressor LexA [Phycisphaerales bacterium]